MSRKFNSKFSNTPSATTLYSLPLAPTSLTTTRIDASSYILNWNDNSFNETLFSIESGFSGLNTYIEVTTVASNIASYTGNNLSAGDTWGTKYTGRFTDVYSSHGGDIVYLSSISGILRSLDFGNNWSRIITGGFNQVKCSADGVIVITQSGGVSGCVYNKTGTNFLRSYANTGNYDISSGGGVIYLTSGRYLQISSDQGVSFTSTGQIPFNDNLYSCACSNDGNIVGVTRQTGVEADLFQSSGGANYSEVASLSLGEGSFRQIKMNSNATLIGFTESGILETLHQYITGGGLINVFSAKNWKDICFSDNNSLIIGIENNGSLWRANGTGQTPVEVFTNKNWVSTNCSTGGNYIYAISSGEVGDDGILYRNNSNYNFRVRAYNPRGYSAYSNTGYI